MKWLGSFKMLCRFLLFMPAGTKWELLNCILFKIGSAEVMKQTLIWMVPMCKYCNFISWNNNWLELRNIQNWKDHLIKDVIFFPWVGFFHLVYLAFAIDPGYSNTFYAHFVWIKYLLLKHRDRYLLSLSCTCSSKSLQS